jgi:hypothetical protein
VGAGSAVLEVAGVRGYVVGDMGGNGVEEHGSNNGGEEALAVCAVITNSFASIGPLLKLGDLAVVTLRAPGACRVLGYQGGYFVSVGVEPTSPTANVEAAVRSGGWVPATEEEAPEGEDAFPADSSPPDSVATSATITAPAPPPSIPRVATPISIPAAATVPTATPSPRTLPGPPPPATAVPPAIPSFLRTPLGVPPPTSSRPGPASATTAVGRTSLSPPQPPRVPRPSTPPRIASTPKSPLGTAGASLGTANARGLRRALAKGDLQTVRSITERLKSAFISKSDPCGSGSSAQAVAPLVSGIACVLSGDNQGALKLLNDVNQMPDIGFSLTWGALIWSARASIGIADGLESALTYAESAARISNHLDVESRALNARLLAEICLHRQEPERAGKFVENARRLSETLADREELGELHLLEAKILLLGGFSDEAIAAAERAHAHREEWIAPVVFLCRCALSMSEPLRAEDVLSPLITQGSTAIEILRLSRLVQAVKRGELTPSIAAEFLALEDSPPSRARVTRLEELSRTYPDMESFRETLGWKLLKAGETDRASVVFDRLGEQNDLPDDIRSSVMLALGCVAAARTRHESSGAKLRATVDAAPKRLQSTHPPAPSSGHMRVANPIDLVSLRPPNSMLPEGELSSPRGEAQRSPVFTGSLQLFCLPDLLEFLRAGRRSGTLVCSSIRGIGAVHLRDGHIAGAASPSTPRLREILLANGKITAPRLDEAAALQGAKKPPSPIGTILVRQGWLAISDLESALRSQAQSAISELLGWGEGQFAFDPESDSALSSEVVEISVDPQSVLLDIFKGLDEQARR